MGSCSVNFQPAAAPGARGERRGSLPWRSSFGKSRRAAASARGRPAPETKAFGDGRPASSVRKSCASGSGGYFFLGAFFFFTDLVAAFFLLRAGVVFFFGAAFPAGFPARTRCINPRM